jgi:hypothetical protein
VLANEAIGNHRQTVRGLLNEGCRLFVEGSQPSHGISHTLRLACPCCDHEDNLMCWLSLWLSPNAMPTPRAGKRSGTARPNPRSKSIDASPFGSAILLMRSSSAMLY